MHHKLSKSPISYVLAQVQFPIIQSIADFIPRLQNSIREFFPHFQPITHHQIILLGDGQQSIVLLKQWHFMDKEKKTGILIDQQNLTIHTSHYEQFQPLLTRFETVLNHCCEILELTIFTRLGLRYINFIENGVQNVSQKLQGFQLEGAEFKDNQLIKKVETIQHCKKGIMRIQATHLADKQAIEGAKNIFVPLDLGNLASLLSYENYREPKQAYLLLDFDHYNTEQGDFDIAEILNYFNFSQELIYQGFRQAVGLENLKIWGELS